jgi:hypothetical protein
MVSIINLDLPPDGVLFFPHITFWFETVSLTITRQVSTTKAFHATVLLKLQD